MSGIYALPIGPIADPDAYNFFIASGTRSPGVCELGGGSRGYVWDTKQGAGAQGATKTYRGWKISDGIKFKIKMWTADQISFFYATFVPLLKYDATKQNPKPISIQYPVLMANDIFNVTTDEIGPLTNAGLQLWTVDVDFSEYRPPAKKNATSTPNGSATSKPRGGSRGGLPSSVLGDKPTAQDAQDAEIQRLVTEFQKPT